MFRGDGTTRDQFIYVRGIGLKTYCRPVNAAANDRIAADRRKTGPVGLSNLA